MQTMSSGDAAGLWTSLRRGGVRCWIMGGWGVDALLSRTSREHHDLDLLVHVDDLPVLNRWLDANGFRRLYDWEESRSVEVQGRDWSTAFVAGHEDGREVDIHAVDVLDGGRCVIATDDPWSLPDDTLDGTGSIDSTQVRCVSSEAQFAMHTGYVQPAHHLEDLAALRGHLEG